MSAPEWHGYADDASSDDPYTAAARSYDETHATSDANADAALQADFEHMSINHAHTLVHDLLDEDDDEEYDYDRRGARRRCATERIRVRVLWDIQRLVCGAVREDKEMVLQRAIEWIAGELLDISSRAVEE